MLIGTALAYENTESDANVCALIASAIHAVPVETVGQETTQILSHLHRLLNSYKASICRLRRSLCGLKVVLKLLLLLLFHNIVMIIIIIMN
jgi:hypothetical protein